jgi:hypothetical protein
MWSPTIGTAVVGGTVLVVVAAIVVDVEVDVVDVDAVLGGDVGSAVALLLAFCHCDST